jgi:diacylglycerol kinase family enzyme
MRSSLLVRAGAGVAAVAMAAAACSSSGGGSHASAGKSPSGMASSPAMNASTTSDAADLYASLDQLLVEHVDLTANVVQVAITKGPSSAGTSAAEAALGQNTDALGAAIGSVYGSAAQQEFLKLWRAHIGFFVNYTLGMATHDTAKVNTAKKDLAGYISQFSTFLAGATKLPKTAVAADLQGHVSTLETVINAIVTKSPDAGLDLQMAAMHMNGTAQVLASGIASSKSIPGDVTSKPSSLRADLTGLLIQHVAATGFVVQTALAAGGNLNAPEVKGAISGLTQNTNQLGAAIGSVYGTAARQQFLKLWNAHIGFFVNYTLGMATHDTAKVNTAKKDLAGYISQFSTFLAGATKLPKTAVAADLQGHVSTLETVIDAMVSGSPSEGSALLMAENHMAGTGAVLAQGIVASKPSMFTS